MPILDYLLPKLGRYIRRILPAFIFGRNQPNAPAPDQSNQPNPAEPPPPVAPDELPMPIPAQGQQIPLLSSLYGNPQIVLADH